MQSSDNSEVLFRETQWFQPRWLWVLVLGVAVIEWYLAMHHRWGHSKVSNILFVFWWVALGIVAPLFLCTYRQTTEVRKDGIYLNRAPFPRASEVVRFSQFNRYQPRVCSPIYSAGGWGILEGWQGKAYNMGGRNGVELCMVGGGRVLIGSCQMRQLLDALHSQCRVKMRRPGTVTTEVVNVS